MDYIGQLCRKEKVSARMIGRTWFVDQESLFKHQKEAELSKHLNGKNLIQKGDSHSAQISQPRKIKPAYPEIGTYAPDPGPFLPVINKQGAELTVAPSLPVEASSPAETSSIEYAMPILITDPVSSLPTADEEKIAAHPFFTRRMVTAMMVAFMLVGVASGTVMFFGRNLSIAEFGQGGSKVASVTTAIEGVGSFLNGAYGSVLALLGHSRALTVNAPAQNQAQASGQSDGSAQGIAVMPSAGTQAADQTAEQQVRDSFSDQVTVQSDQSGTAGVITPVFKDSTSKNFVYVLVPVKKTGDAAAPDASGDSAAAGTGVQSGTGQSGTQSP